MCTHTVNDSVPKVERIWVRFGESTNIQPYFKLALEIISVNLIQFRFRFTQSGPNANGKITFSRPLGRKKHQKLAKKAQNFVNGSTYDMAYTEETWFLLMQINVTHRAGSDTVLPVWIFELATIVLLILLVIVCSLFLPVFCRIVTQIWSWRSVTFTWKECFVFGNSLSLSLFLPKLYQFTVCWIEGFTEFLIKWKWNSSQLF